MPLWITGQDSWSRWTCSAPNQLGISSLSHLLKETDVLSQMLCLVKNTRHWIKCRNLVQNPLELFSLSWLSITAYLTNFKAFPMSRIEHTSGESRQTTPSTTRHTTHTMYWRMNKQQHKPYLETIDKSQHVQYCCTSSSWMNVLEM